MNATDQRLPIASTSQTFSGMRALLFAHPAQAVATIVTLGIGVLAATTAPWLVGAMVDSIGRGGENFGALAAALVMALVVSAVVTWVGRVLLAGVVQRAVQDLRESAFRTALTQPSERLEAAGTGDLVARLSGDIRAIGAVVSTALPAFVTALLTTVLSVAGMGLLDWRLGAAALAASPLQYFALRRFLRQSAPVYREHRAAQAARGQRLIETVRGADTVRALRAERAHLKGLATVSERVIHLELRATHVRNTFYGRLNLAELVGLVAVLFTGFLLVRNDEITLGMATAAALYFLGLFDPIGTLLGTVDDLQDAGASLARLFGLTGMQAVEDPTEPFRRATGRIELHNVSHGYRPGAVDLSSITVTIAAGARVAIVGTSGAGKSSLAKVAAGLLRPDAGTVLLDGTPVLDVHPRHLRKNIAMVSQEPHVFSGTIREDLRLFAPSSSDARLEATITALRGEWIDMLPDGLDTPVGAGGYPLTPSQMQHLALIRLALTDAPVVILDEATAEAGSGDGERLDQAVESIIRGRTSITIAHRLTHAVRADRILVMENGAIVQDGAHGTLIQLDGPYARLWQAHQSGRAAASRADRE